MGGAVIAMWCFGASIPLYARFVALGSYLFFYTIFSMMALKARDKNTLKEPQKSILVTKKMRFFKEQIQETKDAIQYFRNALNFCTLLPSEQKFYIDEIERLESLLSKLNKKEI